MIIDSCQHYYYITSFTLCSVFTSYKLWEKHIFFHLSLLLSLSSLIPFIFLVFFLSPLAVVSPLAYLSQTTKLHLKPAPLCNLIGMNGSSVMGRSSEFTEPSVIGFSSLCLSSRINHVVNRTANQFVIKGKFTVW